MDKRTGISAGVLVVSLALFAVALSSYLSPSKSAPVSAPTAVPGDSSRVDKPTKENTASTVLVSSPVVKPLAVHCDDDDLYKANLDAADGNQEAAEAKTLATVKAWTSECRWAAFERDCSKRCWDFETDRVIEGAASSAEAKTLRAERVKRNAAAMVALEPLLKRVRDIVAKGNRLNAPGRTLSPDCATRMGEDFRTIDALKAEVEDALGVIPIGLVGLKSTLSLAKSCLDCSPNREMCKDMNEDMKSNDEIISDWAKMNSKDAAALR